MLLKILDLFNYNIEINLKYSILITKIWKIKIIIYSFNLEKYIQLMIKILIKWNKIIKFNL